MSKPVHIPSPCAVPWSEMSPVKGGRHCGSCNKTVVDISMMTRANAEKLVANSNGDLCVNGLFDRKTNEFIYMPERRRLPLVSSFAASAAIAIAVSTSPANAEPPHNTQTTQQQQQRPTESRHHGAPQRDRRPVTPPPVTHPPADIDRLGGTPMPPPPPPRPNPQPQPQPQPAPRGAR